MPERYVIGLEELGLDDVTVRFGDTAVGWKGDVPVVRLSSAKLRERNWTNRYSSREALAASARALLEEAKQEATVDAARGERGVGAA